jgi:hypothetical protein
MARRVYFAFHYQKDIWRVNEVRQSWVTQERQDAGFYDASLWEKAQKESDLAIKRMINSGLQNTSATCVLIGSETFGRRWVRYEIIKSLDKGNGLLGVYIHSLKNSMGENCSKGKNPFEYLAVTISADGKSASVKEWRNEKWLVFDDYPTITARFDEQYAGKFFQLSKIGISMYDWTVDDGYKNFNKWIEDSI